MVGQGPQKKDLVVGQSRVLQRKGRQNRLGRLRWLAGLLLRHFRRGTCLSAKFTRKLGFVIPQDVPRLRRHTRAVPNQAVAAPAVLGVDRAGDGENVAALIQSHSGGDQRAAARRRLHHQCGNAQAGHDAVADGKMTGKGLRPRRILGNQTACGGHIVIQPAVFPGVNHIGAAAQHADDDASRPQSALRRGRINSPGKARDHHGPAVRQPEGKVLRASDTVRRRFPRPHHGDGGKLVHRGKPPPDVQETGRVENTPEPDGIRRVMERQELKTQAITVRQDLIRSGQVLLLQDLRFLPGDALGQQDLTLVGVIDVLRRAKMLQ
ncbi:hypothetical protein SDC9_127269 [bioreactor metagenome]|uniref:Uncharacterized protein n=1 Tax=bioreactor metagenome TaxID=1076179 RepID=A0A645CU54_9ZZZZ